MKRIWAIRKDAEAVSPVIATILMVAITVVLAAVLYVMVLGFGGTSQQTPTTQLTKSTVPNGVKLSLAAVSIDTLWSDVSVLLTDGSNNVNWINITTEDLDGGEVIKHNYASKTLGTLVVWLNITDLAGNGYANYGDSLTMTAGSFTSTSTYTVTLMYSPTSSEMTHTSFTG